MNTKPQITPPVHIGVDVAKRELVCDVRGKIRRFDNTPAGIAGLLDIAAPIAGAHLVCEATGGYEKALVKAASRRSIPTSTIQPQRVRKLAGALGIQAKNDPADAALLTRFGAHALPKPSSSRSDSREQLDSLMRYRAELLDSLHREHCRTEHHDHPLVEALAKARIARLEEDIATINAAAAEVIAADPELSRADAALRGVAGVGAQTSRVLLAFMPELGTLNRGQVASLAGLAPFDRDSGTSRGKRFIRAGRTCVRTTLHMAALSASRYNETLRKVYTRLKEAGKPSKVALVAITRKLLIHLNSKMRELAKIPLAD